MTWTTTRPQQPGWYWWREHGHAKEKYQVVDLYDDGVLYVKNGHEVYYLNLMPGSWAGPLSPPE